MPHVPSHIPDEQTVRAHVRELIRRGDGFVSAEWLHVIKAMSDDGETKHDVQGALVKVAFLKQPK